MLALYGPLFRGVLFPTWETHVRRRPVVERWEALRRSQWRSRDELLATQRRDMARLLRHAFDHVPFYRARFEAAGLTPDDLRTPQDLMRLPVVRRHTLQASGAARQATEGPRVTVHKRTSGTTGEPLVFGFEADSEHWRRAVKLRGYEWAGYRPGDRALHFWGAPEPTPPPWRTRLKVALAHRIQRDIYIPCAVMNDENLARVVRVIERERPRVLVCYAQAGAELARYINRTGSRSWSSLPVICGAEQVTPRDRADLQAAFGSDIYETYGCSEVMMIAAECSAHDGMHVAMENLIVDLVVTEDGRERAARDGEAGEVVLTDLHNFAMPFIRYANGDVATAVPDRPCACGRTLPRIGPVQGRISATLRDGTGSPVSGIALSFLLKDIVGAVRQFQAVQHPDRSVTIRLVLSAHVPPATLEQIRDHAQRLLGGLPVALGIVPTLPRTAAGKHHLIIVEP